MADREDLSPSGLPSWCDSWRLAAARRAAGCETHSPGTPWGPADSKDSVKGKLIKQIIIYLSCDGVGWIEQPRHIFCNL